MSEFKMASREELAKMNPFERRSYLKAFWNRDRVKFSDSDQAKNSSQVIRWGASREGYAESKCKRFSISPMYYATTYIQGYDLMDNKTKMNRDHDTQNEAKAAAQYIIFNEEKEAGRGTES